MSAQVQAIERATLAAVPPQASKEEGGWLLGLDDGTVGRAHSAVPLAHDNADARVLPAIQQRYLSRGLAPVFRIPRLPAFEAVRQALGAEGFRGTKPTLTQTGAVASVALLPAPMAGVELASTIGEDWAAVFLGEGFDPVDGASRLAILRRAGNSLFAAVRVEGRVAAVGSACFSHGWMGVHGMRTAPAWRGRGFAAAILAAFAGRASERGIDNVFLQVEEANAKAQALYARAGLRTAWAYEYWAR